MPSGGQKAVSNLGLGGAAGVLRSECNSSRPNGPGSPMPARPPAGRIGDKVNGLTGNPSGGAKSSGPKVGGGALDRAEN